ncbi:MAG: TetR/AcrR family transcriptional regulator [Novosphingobium sp.]
MAIKNAMSDDADDDVLIASLGAMTRGSPAMFARRRRILHETRRMMVEGGVDRMGMRELAERSGVSLRTLYNAFGSKEILIAAAVRQYYDKFLRALSEGRDPYDFDWVLTGIVATNLRNQQIRDYLSGVVGLYFSLSADDAIRLELRRIGAGFMVPWLELLQARRQLRGGTDITRSISHIASLQYAINQEWLAGCIPDDAFVPAILEGVLTHLAGLVRGSAHARIDALLVDLNGSGVEAAALIEAESARINAILQNAGSLWPDDGVSSVAGGQSGPSI